MKTLHSFTVVPHIPERLARLHDIAYNLWWTWNIEAIELWRRVDFDLWEEVYHNPVQLLGSIPISRFEELMADDSFLAHLDRVSSSLDAYMNDKATWFDTKFGDREQRLIAYFSFEYGMAESVPMYSGGLGILSGDHLKSASELGLPLIGVGLLYRQGYFRQYLNSDGWQQEYLPTIDVYSLPLELQVDANKDPILLDLKIGRRNVLAQIWKLKVGRIKLFLLDTNLPANHPDDREITAQLYGGDQDLRIRQEILLGIGGYRAIRKLGFSPSVCHMNEGHAAFLAIERIRESMQSEKLTFDEARVRTSAGNVFTTHTPVPAGNDRFPVERIHAYFADLQKELGISEEQFLALGREDEADVNEWFCMTVLAIKLSTFTNGVSKLHGDVSARMWQRIWPEAHPSEIPIDSITNGIHIRTWLSRELAQLFDRYLGVRWWSNPVDASVWERVTQIPDAELWRAHERRAERLVSFVRRRLKEQFKRRGLPASEINMADEILDPESLTIGFARRFATYKRGTLLFRDPERLARILNNPSRPVQIVFAGKAHPQDNQGKELIRQLAHFCRREEFRHKVVFIEDYDMMVARYMVQGVDIWLNTPRRPLEASGTSGMKAAANGAMHVSIPDGWWWEAYDGENGWSIGSGEDYLDQEYQDRVESETLYELLEKDIVPLYYDRGRDDLPRGWIQRMKRCLITLCPVFNTNRMLRDYSEKFYVPASDQVHDLVADGYAKVHAVEAWKKKVFKVWDKVEILSVKSERDGQVVQVGDIIPLQVEVALHGLDPSDVVVEVFHGKLNSEGEILNGKPMELAFSQAGEEGAAFYRGKIESVTSGRYGYSARVIARHPNQPRQDRHKFIKWG